MYVGATNKKILEDKIGFQKLTEDFDDLSYTAEKVFINPVLGTSEVTFVTTGLNFDSHLYSVQGTLFQKYPVSPDIALIKLSKPVSFNGPDAKESLI